MTNWPAYNAALKRRGDFTSWFTEEAIAERCPAKTGARGQPRKYSNVAIETVLFIRQVFHLALRQTEGFMNPLARALTVEISIPDFSGVSKRSIGLPGHPLSKAMAPGSVVIVDSSGLKVHLAIDEPHPGLACELTTPDAGNTMKARALARQKTAAWIRACALNRMTRFGHAGLDKHLKTDGNGGRFGLASINSTTHTCSQV